MLSSVRACSDELVIAETPETAAHLSEADTPSGRDHVPDLDIAGAGELAQGQLHEVERTTNHDENHQVGDEEGPATILVSGVGKPSNVVTTAQFSRRLTPILPYTSSR